MTPAAMLVFFFALFPIGWSLVLSFQANDLVSTPTWVGLENYRALSNDPLFKQAVVQTVIYTLLFVPISVGGALFIAVALNRRIWFIRLYRTAVFIPVATSTVATAIMFSWLFDPNYGLANFLLDKVGLGPFRFFQSPDGALYSITAVTVWGWIGFDVIIYLAALQGVPKELLEAAEIDGAGRWASFRHVTLPLLGPATLFLLVWSSINAFQLFDEVYVLTRGGPLGKSTVVVYYLYQQAFEFFNGGYGAAIAYVLFVAILLVTIVQWLIGKKMVHYSS